MAKHVPPQPPLVHIGCMCVGEEFTLTETSQTFELYTCNGTGWGLPHKLWLAQLESDGAKAILQMDTNFNVFNLLEVLPNKVETLLSNGMPMPTGNILKVEVTGDIGQSVVAKVYLQVGGGLV